MVYALAARWCGNDVEPTTIWSPLRSLELSWNWRVSSGMSCYLYLAHLVVFFILSLGGMQVVVIMFGVPNLELVQTCNPWCWAVDIYTCLLSGGTGDPSTAVLELH